MQVPAVVVERDSHTVVAAGENIGRLDIEVEADLYGDPVVSRGSRDSLLGEMDFPASISWSVAMERVQPFKDDRYPMSMPNVIGNVGFRADPDDGLTASHPEDVDVIYMSHLFVQDEARRGGYGQLLWDTYLATVAYGDYRAAGGVGSTEGGGTYEFLKRQGVPEADIEPGRKTTRNGTGTVKWSTDPSNIVRGAPIRHTEAEVQR